MSRRPRSRGRSARSSRWSNLFSGSRSVDRALDYKRGRRLNVESLEDRRMLAVNVFVDAVTGNVTVYDDTLAFAISDRVQEDNNVTISNGIETPGRIRITDPGGVILDPAASGSQIDAETVEIDATEILDIDLQDGNDHLTIDGTFGALDLTTVNVHGGGPANNDRLILNGTVGADESLTISPDNPNHDEQNIAGYASAAFTVRGFEYIVYVGEGDNDDLTVDFGFGVVTARVQNAAPGATDEVLSNTMPPILFRDLDLFTLRGDEDEPTTAIFVPDDLQGADNYRFVSLDNADTLIIEGSGGSESITASLSGGNLRIVASNNTIDTTGMTATDLLQIQSLGDDDSFTVNINATALIPTPMQFIGGGGSDVLRIQGTPTTVIQDVIYTPGLQVDEGRLEYRNAAGARLMSIDFEDLEPVIDTAVAVNLTINANASANSISYTQDPADATRGLVSIDGFETMSFNNKVNLIVNALSGDDTIVANNPGTPLGLATVVFNGNEGADVIRLENVNTTQPANSPSVTATGGTGNDTIDAHLIGATEILRLLGNAGDDYLFGSAGFDTIEGGDNNDTIIVSPGDDIIDGGAGADALLIVGNSAIDNVTIAQTAANMLRTSTIATPGNPATTGTDAIANLELLHIVLGDNNDSLTVELANFLLVALPIFYDGGTGSDLLTVQGTLAAGNIDNIVYTPGLQVDEGRLVYTDGAQTMDISFDNLEPVVDTSAAVNLTVNADGSANSISYVQDPLAATRGLVSIDGFETMSFNGKTNLIVNALGGDDTFVASNSLTPTGLQTILVNAGVGNDTVRLEALPNTPFATTVNGNDGNDIIDASLLAATTILVLSGNAGNDTITGGAGTDTLEGGDGDDLLIDSLGGDTFNGGNGFDTILVRGTFGSDTLDVFQLPPSAVAGVDYQVRINGAALVDNITKTIPANAPSDPNNRPTVEEIRVEALAGNDTIRVTHDDVYVDGNNANGVPQQMLRFTVDGGTPNASDRLIVRDVGTGDLVLVRQAPDSRSGRVTVNPVANVFLGDVVYENIERLDILPIDPITGGTGPADPAMQGRVVVFQPDEFEYNDTRLVATDFSDIGTTHRDPNIDPGGNPNFFGPDDGIPGDEDWYEFRPTDTFSYRIGVRFTEIATVASGRPGLPGNGDLDVAIYNSIGDLIAAGVEVAGFGEQVTFNAIEGQSYFLRVKGAALADPFSVAINTYDIDPVVKVDDIGPQIIDVFVTGDPTYDLFNPKPNVDGPTAAVNSLTIRVRDLPLRALGFLDPALNEAIAENPGHYRLVGDNYGIIAIDNIEVTNDPVVIGQAATATIVITFVDQLPDDRFTLTIFDGIVDPSGNQLDGESNNIEPQENPTVPPGPSGDGIPGGDFIARFTVDTAAELGTWSGGSVYLDINGNYVFDPQSGDLSNRDLATTLGFTTDFIFAGNFVEAPGGVANGFDKLALYGTANGQSRWLFDFSGTLTSPLTSKAQATPLVGTPVAGNFDGIASNGDEIGLFTGTSWVFDNNRNFTLDDAVRTSAMRGLPVAGNFDNQGADDLATWDASTNTFQFSLTSLGGGPTNPIVTSTFRIGNGFPFLGTRERPVAGDLDGDGLDELGLFVPDRSGVPAQEVAEWFLFSSKDPVTGNSVGVGNRTTRTEFGIAVLDFIPKPFGFDIFAQFGDEFALPVVGNFDPPVGSSVSDPPELVGDYNSDDAVNLNDRSVWTSTFGSTTDLAADGNNDNQINIADYVIWRDNLGSSQSSAASATGVAPASMSVAHEPDAPATESESVSDTVTLAWLDQAFESLGAGTSSERVNRSPSQFTDSNTDLLLLLAQESFPKEDEPLAFSLIGEESDSDESDSDSQIPTSVRLEFEEVR